MYNPPVYNYIGSKINLLTFIQQCIEDYTGKGLKDIESVVDAFCGTGAVSYMFLANNIPCVIANDNQRYAYIMTSTIDSKTIDLNKMSSICAEINKHISGTLVVGEDDFIAVNFTEHGEEKRKYFTVENGVRIDRVRQMIERVRMERILSDSEYNFLLKCLLHAVIKVSNITCVYGAFLKAFKEGALQVLQLVSEEDDLKRFVLEGFNGTHVCHNKDVFEFLKENNGGAGVEVMYLDPPYSNRRYDTSYHLLETISLYDSPVLRGKTGLRPEPERAYFSSKTGALNDFDRMFGLIKSKYIFLSYSSDGNVSRDDMIGIMSKYFCDIRCFETHYKRIKTNVSERTVQPPSIKEYIFAGKLLQKREVTTEKLQEKNIRISLANICDEIANIASILSGALRNG
jgi:adenine-specific DNA-methyltransferase